MIMIATVTQVDRQSLLVRNDETGEEVLVLFRGANTFSVGDRVRITYNGQMTLSIPPQITATAIQRLGTPPRPIPPRPNPPRPTPPRPTPPRPTPPRPTPPSPNPPGQTPSEVRAVVLQRGRNFLLVQTIRERQQLRVEYPFAHHFCVGQWVDVRYDTITFTNPPRVTATDIIPAC